MLSHDYVNLIKKQISRDERSFQDVGETALHLAILREMGSSLHIVDFLVQNMPSGGIDRATIDGETALHLSARHDRAEAMKLLLRAGADPSQRNKQDKTPLDIAQEMGHHTCKELVIQQIVSSNKYLFRYHLILPFQISFDVSFFIIF